MLACLHFEIMRHFHCENIFRKKKTRLSLEYLVILRIARGFEMIAVSNLTIYLAINHVFRMVLKLIYFFLNASIFKLVKY